MTSNWRGSITPSMGRAGLYYLLTMPLIYGFVRSLIPRVSSLFLLACDPALISCLYIVLILSVIILQ